MDQATFLRVMRAVYETIEATGATGAPAGVIYAALMGHGIDLQTYQALEGMLIRSGLITKTGHMLHVVRKAV